MSNREITICGRQIKPGERATVEVPIPNLYTHTPMFMVVHVVRGKKDGPRLFVSAAMHGDELNGIEVVRRLLKHKSLHRVRGTLIATVGRGMMRTPGMAAKVMSALAGAGVNIRMIDQGSSEINIIVGVETADFEKAVQAIYNTFVT